MSDTTFFSRLAKAQSEIKPAAMDGINPHFKSKYATLASLHAACIPIMTKSGFAISQDVRVDGDIMYCRTSILADDGSLVCDVPMACPKNGTPQQFGSALTYARRYSLATALGLVSDEDDDANAAQPKQQQAKPAQSRPSPARVETDEDRIVAGLRATGVPDSDIGMVRDVLMSDYDNNKSTVLTNLRAWHGEGLRYDPNSGTWKK